MNLDKFLVVAGVPGVHKLVATRANGLIIEDRNEGRTRFVPVRQQQVTPLATIAVYTDSEEGTVPLAEVFTKMLERLEDCPLVSPDAKSDEFRAYFSDILPDHDRDRVHINDIKKCLKWFKFMLDKGIFEEIKKDEVSEEVESAAPETPAVADAASAAPEIEAEPPANTEATPDTPTETAE